MSSPPPSSVSNNAAGGGAPDLYQNGPNSSDQWLRRWTLTLTGTSGTETISQDVPNIPAPGGQNDAYVDGLRITFRITQNRVGTPGRATIRIYNCLLTTGFTSQAAQFNRVQLSAGYVNGYFGIIFDGVITYIKRGREENLVDTYLEINAQVADYALNGSTINTTIAAGGSESSIVQQAVKAMVPNGVTEGTITGLSSNPLPRGRPLYGMAVDTLKDVGAAYFVQNGVLNVYNPKQPIPGQTFVLNSFSGLVGIPEVTADGVEVTTLINASFQLMTQVQINQSEINQIQSSQAAQAGVVTVQPPLALPTYFADTSADGMYVIYAIEYEGDSRGRPWYCHLICNTQAANGTLQLPLGSQGLAAPPMNPDGSTPGMPVDPGLGPTSGQIGIYKQGANS